jgi:hypothetical protein
MALRPVHSVRFAPYANVRIGAVVPERGFYVLPSGSDADLYWSDGKATTYSVQREGKGGQTPLAADDAVLARLNSDTKLTEEQGQAALTAKTGGKSVLAALGVPARTAAPAPAPAPTPTVAPSPAPAPVAEAPSTPKRAAAREEAATTVAPPHTEAGWMNKRTIGVSAAILAGLVFGGLLVRSVTDVSDETMTRSRSRLG